MHRTYDPLVSGIIGGAHAQYERTAKNNPAGWMHAVRQTTKLSSLVSKYPPLLARHSLRKLGHAHIKGSTKWVTLVVPKNCLEPCLAAFERHFEYRERLTGQCLASFTNIGNI